MAAYLPEIMDALRGIERVEFAKNRFKAALQASLIVTMYWNAAEQLTRAEGELFRGV